MTISRLGKDAYEHFSIDERKNIRYMQMNYRSKGILVFSAKWCQHCQALAPVLQRLDVFAQNSIPIVIVDVDEDQVLQKVFSNNGLHINGFPTIFMLDVDGRVLHETYQGQRNLESLYLQTQTSEACQKSCGTSRVYSEHALGYAPSHSLWADTNQRNQTSLLVDVRNPSGIKGKTITFL